MKRLKLKSNVKKYGIIAITFIAVIIFISIGIYSYINIKKQKELEETPEYKLKKFGYSEDDIKVITKFYKTQELNFFLENKKNDDYIGIISEKHFIKDYFNDYLNYLKEERSTNYALIVEKVNTKTNQEYYTDPEVTDISKNELMLVNKYYHLPDDYAPELVTIPLAYSFGELGSQKCTQDTYDAYLRLWSAAKDAGFYLMVNSSYRTHQKQEEIYNQYKNVQGVEYADDYAARPGYSEHETGYAINVTMNGYTDKTFKDTDAYPWLKDNAYKYGFILRYPEGKEEITGFDAEAGHLRYVGVEAATYIHENNITFDEYYAYFVK